MITQLLTVAAILMLALSPNVQTAANLTGDWTVILTTAGGKVTGKASLKQTGDKVAGQIGPVGDPTIPIEGVLVRNKLTMKTSPRAGRTSAFEYCDLTVTDDKMTGTIRGGDAGEGTIEFVRIKK